MSLTERLLHLLPRVHSLVCLPLRDGVAQFDDPSRLPSNVGPLYDESLHAMWFAEERMPVALRRLYYRELSGPGFGQPAASNGNCMGADAYEWSQIHPSATERARAFVRTHILAELCVIYDRGDDHPMIDYLQEEFATWASEAGADREGDFDAEAWQESAFEVLFAPLREGYKP